MIRLIGILTGSALGIAILILVFGLPDLAPRAGETTDENAIEPARQATTPAEIAEIEAPPMAEVVLPPVAEVPPQEEAPATAELVAPEDSTETLGEASPPAPLPVEERAVATPAPQNWYAFWSPFRSRIAADGFIAELQRTTGLDYRVVKLKPGIYEVAFAYTDDADIKDKLNRIATATGMDMSGG